MPQWKELSNAMRQLHQTVINSTVVEAGGTTISATTQHATTTVLHPTTTTSQPSVVCQRPVTANNPITLSSDDTVITNLHTPAALTDSPKEYNSNLLHSNSSNRSCSPIMSTQDPDVDIADLTPSSFSSPVISDLTTLTSLETDGLTKASTEASNFAFLPVCSSVNGKRSLRFSSGNCSDISRATNLETTVAPSSITLNASPGYSQLNLSDEPAYIIHSPTDVSKDSDVSTKTLLQPMNLSDNENIPTDVNGAEVCAVASVSSPCENVTQADMQPSRQSVCKDTLPATTNDIHTSTNILAACREEGNTDSNSISAPTALATEESAVSDDATPGLCVPEDASISAGDGTDCVAPRMHTVKISSPVFQKPSIERIKNLVEE